MADERNPQENETSVIDHGAVLAAWEFLEHDHHERTWRWYLIAGGAALALLIYTYIDGNFLLAVIIGLGIFIFGITEFRGPDIRAFALTEDGIEVGDAFYPYAEIANFFIIYEPPDVKILYFNPKSIFRTLVGVPMLDQDPNELRTILANYLTEDIEREGEPVSDFLGRLFKF